MKVTDVILPTSDVELEKKFGCSGATCFLKVSTRPSRSAWTGDGYSDAAVPMPLTVPPAYFFLRPIKDAALDPTASIKLTSFELVAPGLFEFDVSVNASSPFLFLELKNSLEEVAQYDPARPGVYRGIAAGWFSDNNFVAEAGKSYRIRYSQFRAQGKHAAPPMPAETLDLATFKQLLQARTLQDAYKC